MSRQLNETATFPDAITGALEHTHVTAVEGPAGRLVVIQPCIVTNLFTMTAETARQFAAAVISAAEAVETPDPDAPGADPLDLESFLTQLDAMPTGAEPTDDKA